MDGEDTDPSGLRLGGAALREADQRRLGHGGARQEGTRTHTGATCHVDDPPAASGQHAWQNRLRTYKRTANTDLNASPPVGGVDFQSGPTGPGVPALLTSRVHRSQLSLSPVDDLSDA